MAVQVTGRDEAMLEWLSVVRLADIEALRWALAALGGREDPGIPVSARKAQQWSARMLEVGLIGRARPAFQQGAVIWPTRSTAGRTPDLFRQTTRHELSVARASARFLARGYTWARDRRPLTTRDHQADGVAIKDGLAELVEVELSPKTPLRYKAIHNAHADRLGGGGISRIVYLCTAEAARTVLREADRYLFRDLRPRLIAVPVMDARGTWVGDDDAPWATHLLPPVPVGIPAPEVSSEVIV